MAINVGTRKRAQVSDEFLDEYRQALVTRVEKTKLDDPDGTYLQRLLKEYTGVLPFLTGKEGASDKMVTRLRALKYTDFSVINVQGHKFFAGMTEPVLLCSGEIPTEKNAYEMGPYMVYIPFEAVSKVSMKSGFHMIPVNNPKAVDRHPHHGSGRSSKAHPLLAQPNTCWGSMGTMITGMLRSGDLVEIFRTVHIYLVRWNPRSELRRGWRSWAKPYQGDNQ